jgi:hypothetical protein
MNADKIKYKKGTRMTTILKPRCILAGCEDRTYFLPRRWGFIGVYRRLSAVASDFTC